MKTACIPIDKRMVTVFNPGMMLRFGGHVWTDVHPPLTMGGGWGDNAPVLVFDDQGGGVMSVEHDIVPTLRTQTHGHEPIVMLEVIDDEKPHATSE